MEEPKNKKALTAVSDDDLSLGHQLHAADAAHWGAHSQVDVLLKPKRRLAGRGHESSVLGVSQTAGGGSSAIDANDSGGLHSETISGKTSNPGPETDTGEGVQRTNSAGSESASTNERRQ